MLTKRKRMLGFMLSLIVSFHCSICNAATYEYDNLNRVTKVTYEDGSYEKYTYDKNGNIVSCEKKGIMPSSEPVYSVSPQNSESPKPTKTPNPTLSEKHLRLICGQTATLKVNGYQGKVEYRSKNKNIANVHKSSGKITAKKPGKTVIYVNVNKKIFTCMITVTLPRTVITSAKIRKKSIKLTWKKVKYAKNYQIYRSVGNNKNYKLWKTTKSTKIEDKEVKTNVKYYYRVQCTTGDKMYNSGFSNEKSLQYKK